MTSCERNMLADIKRSLVRIYEYCDTRSIYSDGERDLWEYVSKIAKDAIRETAMLEAVGEEHNGLWLRFHYQLDAPYNSESGQD